MVIAVSSYWTRAAPSKLLLSRAAQSKAPIVENLSWTPELCGPHIQIAAAKLQKKERHRRSLHPSERRLFVYQRRTKVALCARDPGWTRGRAGRARAYLLSVLLK